MPTTSGSASHSRHVYRKLAFTSDQVSPETMNLFKGFGCEAVQGNCSLILRHIFEVWCSSDEKLYDAMLNLIAFQLQKIGHASRIIVVLISRKQQAGKGIIMDEVMLPIFGDAGYATVRIQDATGDFNDAMRGRALFMLDEALFGGDKAAASKIKGIVATHRLSYNAKFLPLVTLPSAINLWILSNADQPAYIEEEDARYWTLRVNEDRVGDHDYFKALATEARNGGREAFLYEMLHHDISSFEPQRDVPRNNDVHADIVQRGANQGDPRFYLAECLESGQMLYVSCTVPGHFGGEQREPHTDWEPKARLRSHVILAGYREWVSKLKAYGAHSVPMQDFWQVMTDVGFEMVKSNGIRYRLVPDPKACEEALVALWK